ncbi:Conserved_hypothetical protein [Hexamita inflata]|uniref:Uncharacterized protein n=1 Tax=Hexamita inflata TaxID=28002 RepID=A0ABP1HHN0_9EUKA
MQNIITLQANNLELDCIFTPKLQYLTYLNLSANPVRDTSMLKWQDQLDTLDLCSTNITCIDFVKPLFKLTKLSISLNQIVDISPITFVQNLYFLNVNECKICNIELLSKLIELQHVYLRSNRILDVTPSTAQKTYAILILPITASKTSKTQQFESKSDMLLQTNHTRKNMN